MIYISDGPSVCDPSDLLMIRYMDDSKPKPPEGVVGFIYLGGAWFYPIRIFSKVWWVNLYRITLVGLIRRHVRRTIQKNKEYLNDIQFQN